MYIYFSDSVNTIDGLTIDEEPLVSIHGQNDGNN